MKNNELDDYYSENDSDDSSALVDQKQTRLDPDIRRRLDDHREQQELKRLLNDVFDEDFGDDFGYLDDIA